MNFVLLTLFGFGLVSAQYSGQQQQQQQPGGGQYRPQQQPPPQQQYRAPQQQYRAPPQQYRAPQAQQPSYNSYTTTTPRPNIYHPPASVHYVNIGQKLAGDYKFGYDTGKGPAGQSFREEVRLDDGTVKGAYGYLDSNGKMRIVRYTAGKNGYVVEGDEASEKNTQGRGQAGGQARPAPRAQPAYRAPQPAAAAAYYPQPAAAPAPRPTAPYTPQPQYRQAAAPTQYRAPQQYQAPRQGPAPQQQQHAPYQTGNPYGLAGVDLISIAPTGPKPDNRNLKPGEQEEYYGPSIINGALLTYNIGSG